MIGSALKKGIGGVGGAILGGAGLIGAGLISSAGAGKYVAGAAAIGAGAKTGANWLGNKSFGGSGSLGGKEDTTEELSKVSSIGMLSVEKLDAIYNNVLDLRKFFADQDPVAQEREKALDEKVKNKELIAAIRGISTGKGGGGMPEKLKTGFLELLKDLLAISAIAALFANLDKIREFLDKLPGWAEKISDAIDNIMEFVNDLDSFFENLGIEFGGAAGRGITRGITRATKNYNRRRGPYRSISISRVEQIKKNRADKIARDKEAKRLKKLKEKFARQKLIQARLLEDSQASQKKKDNAKAQREKLNKQMEAERERLRNQRAANAAAQEIARRNAEREAARNQRLKSAAGKLFNIAEVKPTGQGPNTTKGKFPKTDYKPRGRGGMASGIGNYLIALLTSKGRPMGPPQSAYGEGYDRIFNKEPKLGLGKLGDLAKNMVGREGSTVGKMDLKTLLTSKGRPMGPPQSAYGEGYDRIFNKEPKPTTTGPTKRGADALTQIAKKMFMFGDKEGRGTSGTGAGKQSNLMNIFKNIKNIPLDILEDYRNQGVMRTPGAISKLKSLDKFLGQQPWIGRILKFVGWTWFGLLAAMDLFNLASSWLVGRTPGDFNPLDDSSAADNNFKKGLVKIIGTYGGGYLGAVIGGILGSMLPLPFIGTVLGSVTGGFIGSMLADAAVDVAYGDKQIATFKVFTKNYSRPRSIDKRLNDVNELLAIKKKDLLIGGQGFGSNPDVILKQIDSLEKEKENLIAERGALDQNNVFVYSDTNNETTVYSQSSVKQQTLNISDRHPPMPAQPESGYQNQSSSKKY